LPIIDTAASQEVSDLATVGNLPFLLNEIITPDGSMAALSCPRSKRSQFRWVTNVKSCRRRNWPTYQAGRYRSSYERSAFLRIRLRRKPRILCRTSAGISSGRSDREVVTVLLYVLRKLTQSGQTLRCRWKSRMTDRLSVLSK